MDPYRLGTPLTTMNPAQKALKVVDRFQRHVPALAYPVAVWKKFNDDQAGNLAALVAYYAFVSIFPLLAVLVTVLDIVLRDHKALQDSIKASAVKDYPGFGDLLTNSVHSFHDTGPALVLGLILTFFGARGVANAMQNALNSVWEVPKANRPGFPWSYLRSFALIVVVGLGEIVTSVLSGFISGGHFLPGLAIAVLVTAGSLLLNMGLFWLAFRLAAASVVTWRELRLGAIVGGCIWQILQLIGGAYVGHELRHSTSLYGSTLGAILVLIAYLYLQAEATLYVAEANVVWVRKLWPRSLAPPPHTDEDLRAYRLYAEAEARKKNEIVQVNVTGIGEDEKMPEERAAPPGTTQAGPEEPAVSATPARGEDPHDPADHR